ncbi:hypothetical protein [Actinoplanes sp. URMC 104]|uniref:hypothetical protein n=1 Tax=Actinoplanes sp. URMC 104 TaxID=3423409 RepID=UPI003F1D6C3F
MAEIHVTPKDDLITHEDSGFCVCGPRLDLIRHPSGATKWAYIHPSLDNRENQQGGRT